MVIRNFLFHRVSDEVDTLATDEASLIFPDTVFLTQNTGLSLGEFLDDPDSFKTGNKALATISFDDGYKDNIECAAPILKKFKCPASFYIVTDCIDKNIPTWTYLVDHAFRLP
ncbi:MAG: polysaccharide deacetylase family protein [Chitinophagaceae bacterium]|nr:polysaccharide deacetylase family protein [Chitinophagaceae bacterium]